MQYYLKAVHTRGTCPIYYVALWPAGRLRPSFDDSTGPRPEFSDFLSCTLEGKTGLFTQRRRILLNGVVAWHEVSSFVFAFETRVEHSIPSRRTYYRQSTRGAEGLGPVSRLSSVVSRSTRQVSVSGRSFTLSILNNDSFFSVGRPGRTLTRSNRSRWVGCRRENRFLRRAAFFARLHSSNAERKQTLHVFSRGEPAPAGRFDSRQ